VRKGEDSYGFVIVGAGPVGLTSAVYGASDSAGLTVRDAVHLRALTEDEVVVDAWLRLARAAATALS
jgi:hypothetical protein